MYRGITGAKPSRQNQRAQARDNAKALKTAEVGSSSSSKRPNLEELFGPLLRNWASPWENLLIGEVINQGDRDICWAVCLAYLLQAIYNMENPLDKNTFSFEALVGHIEKTARAKSLGLANLKKAFNHIRKDGMMKTPTKGVGKAGDKGKTVQDDFDLFEDVDSLYIRQKLDQYPAVALRLEIDEEFSKNSGQAYYLPMKNIITEASLLHCIILFAYGEEDGNLFFIGLNSYGEEWGCHGFVKIFINHQCDVIHRRG